MQSALDINNYRYSKEMYTSISAIVSFFLIIIGKYLKIHI